MRDLGLWERPGALGVAQGEAGVSRGPKPDGAKWNGRHEHPPQGLENINPACEIGAGLGLAFRTSGRR